MIVHVVDGTYELFRHFYGLRRFTKGQDPPFGAVLGVLQTLLQMIEQGATHVGVATDHIIESFRNRIWPGYKTSDGIEPALLAQFHPLEEALAAMGVVVWPMTELEADDALASAARIASEDRRVEKICIWTPDKDLAQCARGDRVVQEFFPDKDPLGKTIRAEGTEFTVVGTFEKIGTVLGQAWSSEAMSVVFFAIAAGSILYVVQELMAVNRSYGRTALVTWLVVAGILLGFATDFVVSAAGV